MAVNESCFNESESNFINNLRTVRSATKPVHILASLRSISSFIESKSNKNVLLLIQKADLQKDSGTMIGEIAERLLDAASEYAEAQFTEMNKYVSKQLVLRKAYKNSASTLV